MTGWGAAADDAADCEILALVISGSLIALFALRHVVTVLPYMPLKIVFICRPR